MTAAGHAGGACLCGALRFDAAFPSKWVAHCHCSMCRRAHGAAFVTWVGFEDARVRVDDRRGTLHWFASSPGAERGFCGACGSTLFFRSNRWPGETHLVVANFDDPLDRAPQAHVFYDTHVPWFEVADALPQEAAAVIDFDVVALSRLQFALTALYHFLFVPLTLGLSWLLAIMESVYVMTGRPIWQRMTRFWGLLFGINFAMGVATGLTMEFQFGTNWAYFSTYVGDIFGVPLALEGLMAFFLEATFIGLFFFGWDKLGRIQHLAVTWLVALGSNFSALWILIANGWMQNPVGAEFNVDTLRMELTSFKEVLFNPVAQAKFVHTVSAGYVVGSMFVLSISAWYLLRGRHVALAKRSLTVAASFGLASALSVVVLGDESGYSMTEHQKMKIASIEAMWHTEPAPASFTVFGWPDVESRETHAELRLPWLLGLIATRSLDQEVPGIQELVAQARGEIEDGLVAYDALETLRLRRDDGEARMRFDAHKRNLGYALLLRRYVDDPRTATAAQIEQAAWSTVPNVPVLFWSFRLMVLLGVYFIALFAYSFWLASGRPLERQRRYLKLAFLSLPLPWIAAELGWIVAEYGRQPWAIEGVLPTFLGVSAVSPGQVLTSLIGFVLFYSLLAIADVVLMVKFVRRGPEAEGH